MEPTTVINEAKWPDSCDFGSGTKGGGLKIYFNASDKEEANQRIANALELFSRAKEGFEKIVK